MAHVTFITAEEEYRKDQNITKEKVQHLRNWVQTQPDLPPELSDEKLIAYIKCSDYDLDKAKAVVHKDWTLRDKHPDLLAELDPATPAQQHIWTLVEYWVSREVSPEGYRICYAGLHNPDSSKYNFLEAMKAAIMVLWSDLAERGTCPGFVFILNAKGTSFGHVLKASITTIRAFLTYAQEGNPMKIIAVHVINVSYIVDKLMILTRPFIGRTLYDMIHLHPDMQTFYNAMPPNVLPSELGGTAGTLAELRNAAKIKAENYRSYFLAENELLQKVRRLRKGTSNGINGV